MEGPFFQYKKKEMPLLRNVRFKVHARMHTHTHPHTHTMGIRLKMQTGGAFAFLNLEADEPQCDKQKKDVKPSRASYKQWDCHLSATVSC